MASRELSLGFLIEIMIVHPISTADITKAIALLRSGKLVAFPTETVYGLGADASNEAAVRRIFLAKERPYDHPLIVHVGHIAQLDDWACDIPASAKQLAQAFWPGPLTILLKKQPKVLDIVTGGQATIGLRIPNHPTALALLKAFAGGVAAPSANKFTHISPTTAKAVQEELGSKVDLVLDGGNCAVGIESTIIDMSGDHPTILRPGMITQKELTTVLGRPVLLAQAKATKLHAPGMHHVHYAPMTPTLLLAASHIPAFLQSLAQAEWPVALIMHSHVELPQSNHIHRLQLPPQAVAYAHDLYRTLRSIDHLHFKRIIIEAVPDQPEWTGITDRLNKASFRDKR